MISDLLQQFVSTTYNVHIPDDFLQLSLTVIQQPESVWLFECGVKAIGTM